MKDEIKNQLSEYNQEYVKIVFKDSRKIKGFIEFYRSGDGHDCEAFICLAGDFGGLLFIKESEISLIEIDQEKRGMEYQRFLSERHKCPVCGKAVFLGECSTYDVCPECGWEDDRIMEDSPNDDAGANEMSLNEYRRAYRSGWRPTFLYEDDDW